MNDDITQSIIKVIISQSAIPFTYIFNKSSQNDQYPSKYEIARILRIHKYDDKKWIYNYRPIYVLSYFSIILKRLLNYLTINKILSDKQYGFREGHSTDMALLHMMNDITEELDNKLFCIGIYWKPFTLLTIRYLLAN